MPPPLTVGSLFSGIGGIDLGLERAGMTVAWQSEIDPYASKVLAKHWPDVPNLGDITAIHWNEVPHVDVIAGGYPCQPFSLAGVRRGADDPRHLWPHFHRAIRHLRPRYALLENVPGHLSMGFDRVLGDLAEIGYDTEWCSIPAAAVGAPHLRWRLFCIAAAAGGARRRQNGRSTPSHEGPDAGRATQHDHIARRHGEIGEMADTDGGRRLERDEGLRRLPVVDTGSTDVADTDGTGRGERRWPIATPTQYPPAEHGSEDVAHTGRGERQRPRLERTQDGDRERHLHHWAVEPDVGRVAHGIPRRVDRLRCLGNAVVPQVTELVGRWIVDAAA